VEKLPRHVAAAFWSTCGGAAIGFTVLSDLPITPEAASGVLASVQPSARWAPAESVDGPLGREAVLPPRSMSPGG
jgi:hypothetical protein